MTSIAHRASRVVQSARTKGLPATVRYALRMAGMRFDVYYWVRELLPTEIPEKYRLLPEGYQFVRIADADFDEAAKLQGDGENVTAEKMRERARQGHTCLGIKRGEQVVAYTWFALDRTQTVVYQQLMRPNEAYLFNAYVLPEERGKNLAVIMRYRSYEMLRDLGRDTLYSVTIRSNKASWRFKAKLGAEKVFMAVSFAMFHKLDCHWILRRYRVRST